MKDPIGRIRRGRKDRYITDDELIRLLNSRPAFHWARLCAEFQAFCGLRSEEAVCININDFSRDFTKLRVRLCKSDRVIERDLPDEFKKKVIQYCRLNYQTFKEGWLFPGQHTGHIKKQSYWEEFRQMRKEVKLDIDKIQMQNANSSNSYRIGTHSLRRWFITNLYKKTQDIVLVKHIIGHEKIDTTLQYCCFDPHSLGIENKLVNQVFNKYFTPFIVEVPKEQRTLLVYK